MSTTYLYIKAAHVIAVIAWMAGMLYLPRLYAYHADAGANTPQAQTFKIMERRLLRIVMNPAMIVAILLGLYLGFFSGAGWAKDGWLHTKIALVVLLVAIHGMLAKWRKDFEADRIPHSPRFFRILNEVPAVLLVFITILVVVKPF